MVFHNQKSLDLDYLDLLISVPLSLIQNKDQPFLQPKVKQEQIHLLLLIGIQLSIKHTPLRFNQLQLWLTQMKLSKVLMMIF